MVKPKPFPEAKWLAELTALTMPKAGSSGYLTTGEIAIKLHKSVHAIRLMLAQAKTKGRLERRSEPREGLDGRTQPVACYRVGKP